MNKIILLGRLSRDTELKFSPTGLPIAQCSIAVDDGFGDKKKTYFFNFTIFGKFAETFAEWSFKGQQVLIEGKMTQQTYEKDGKKQYRQDIIAEQVKFLERKRTPEFDSPVGLAGEIIETDDLPW